MIKKIFLLLKFDLILNYFNRTPRVLFWHGVDIDPNPIIEGESIDIVNFAKQIDYIEKYYEIISIEEFYRRFISAKFTNKEVVLTFDDGYLNNLTVLAPFLKERNLPFTVFISTNHINTGDIFPTSLLRLIIFGSNLTEITIGKLSKTFVIKTLKEKTFAHSILSKFIKQASLEDVRIVCSELISNLAEKDWIVLKNRYKGLKLLNWSEVIALREYGGTIGSHCMDHICCHDNQKKDDIEQQIILSKKVIEDKLGFPCDYFAYPNGDYTTLSNEIVKKAGYKMGFCTKKEKITINETDINALPRLGLPFNINTFKIFLNLYPKK